MPYPMDSIGHWLPIQKLCGQGLEELLKHLRSRGLRAVSVGKLAELADQKMSHL